ncbi:MAG: hypothetical protein ACKOGA_09410, partial [Planctomycetaceae bacterium]
LISRTSSWVMAVTLGFLPDQTEQSPLDDHENNFPRPNCEDLFIIELTCFSHFWQSDSPAQLTRAEGCERRRCGGGSQAALIVEAEPFTFEGSRRA